MNCSPPDIPVHHQLLELTQTHVHQVGDGHGGLACCSSWDCKESYTTEQLNWTESIWKDIHRLCANTVTFHIRDLNIDRFLVSERVPGTHPPQILRDDYTSIYSPYPFVLSLLVYIHLSFLSNWLPHIYSEVKWIESCSVVPNSLRPHELYSPWNSPGQNTGVGNLSFLQGIFPTQGLNPGLPHCRQIIYCLRH